MSTIENTLPGNRAMIDVAKRRGIVRLTDGQLATLVSWGTRNKSEKTGANNRVRLEAPNGVDRWTAKKSDVIEVVQ